MQQNADGLGFRACLPCRARQRQRRDGARENAVNTAMPDETQRVLRAAKHPIITPSTGDPEIWSLTLQAN